MYSSPAVELQLDSLYDVSICVFGASGRVERLPDPNLHRSSIALKRALSRPHMPRSSPAGFYGGTFLCDLLVLK